MIKILSIELALAALLCFLPPKAEAQYTPYGGEYHYGSAPILDYTLASQRARRMRERAGHSERHVKSRHVSRARRHAHKR